MTEKIVCSVRLTPRQVSAIDAKAKRIGASFGETLRREIDRWLDEVEPKAPSEAPRIRAL